MKSCAAFCVAAFVASSPAAAVKQEQPRLAEHVVPKIENSASDKGFFGPPFPADYPHDTQPQGGKRAKKGDFYPEVQPRGFLDNDFVKDENGDGGEWKAQMAYDETRIKAAKEERLMKEYYERAGREKEAYDKVKKEAQAAAADAAQAKNDADQAEEDAQEAYETAAKAAKEAEESKKASEEAQGKKQEEDELLSEQRELEKKVQKAEEKFEEQKAAFEKCKKDYEDAKAELQELKEKLAKFESTVDKNSMNLLLHADKNGQDLRAQAQAARAKSDQLKAQVAVATERQQKAAEALKKQESEKIAAEEALAKQSQSVESAKADMQSSKDNLRTLRRGDKPARAPKVPRSFAPTASSAPWLLISALSLRFLLG